MIAGLHQGVKRANNVAPRWSQTNPAWESAPSEGIGLQSALESYCIGARMLEAVAFTTECCAYVGAVPGQKEEESTPLEKL